MKLSISRMLSAGFKVVLAFIVISLLCFFVIFKAKQITNDIWDQLGLTIPEANRNINNSFIYGSFQYYGAKYAKNIVIGDRVAVINQLVAYARKYYNSQEFKTAYKEYRTRAMPAEPVQLTITAESIKADERKRLENALKVAEDGLNSTNPKIKNGAPTRIENIKKEMAALDDPNNPTIKRRLDDANRSNEYALKLHKDAVQKFESSYPEDPEILLKKRLQTILDITTDVDYSAELREEKGKKYFVNLDYEKKPKEWKLAYRAGKSTTDAVRSAAQQWLKELK